MKRCSKCEQWKSGNQFSGRKKSKDELNCWCKDCMNIYNKNHPRKYSRKHSQKYYKKNSKKYRARRKEGYKKAPEWDIWYAMKQRCHNSKHSGYRNYGGRGIKVCDRWLNSFKDFLKDIGKRPSLKHSIDRVNNDSNYEPGNCRWATRKQQANNKRRYHQSLRDLNTMLFMLCMFLIKKKGK